MKARGYIHISALLYTPEKTIKGFVKRYRYSCSCAVEHHAMKVCWGSRGTAPRVLGLGIRC